MWVLPTTFDDRRVKEAVERVQKKLAPRWTAKQFLEAVRDDPTAMPLLLFRGEQQVGVAVTAIRRTVYSRESTLDVELLYLEAGALEADAWAALETLAQDLGVSWIRFETPRRGWERVAKQYGFTPVSMMFERRVA